MKPIILPNNNFGCAIMTILLALLFIVPFTLTAWLVLLIAPWWVAGPLALLVAVVTFVKLTKFKD